MGLLVLVLGLILFLGPHVLVTLRNERAELIRRLGEWPYLGLFAAVSVVGLYLIGKGFGMYHEAGPIAIWSPPNWTRHITETLMLPACIFVAATYLPGDIKRMLKHPTLVAVKTWAVAHLIANGDLGRIILFGSVLAWAVYDRITLKRRSDPGGPTRLLAWLMPEEDAHGGGAVLFGVRKNDIAAVVVGIILYFALAFPFHSLVVGRAVFGTPAFGT